MLRMNLENFVTSLEINEGYEGEMLETKVERIMTLNEPITDGAPLIYTRRSDGVGPEYNIRTDRFDVAIDAMDKVAKSYTARRDEKAAEMKVEKGGGENGGESESGGDSVADASR
jgi:hypothetical protein